MKTTKTNCLIYVAISFSSFVFSCCEKMNEETMQECLSYKYIPKPVVLPTNTLRWDESFHPNALETRTDVNHSDEMAVITANIYIGAPYTARSVEILNFVAIPNRVKPIDVSYTFPRYFFDHIEYPSISGMYRSMNKALESPNFTGRQSLSFEYDFREFSYYRELKLAFGANIDIANIFKLDASLNDTKINSKSGLFARMVQKNFAMIMDYPINGNLFLNEPDLKDLLSQSPIYINSIVFGRMAIIAIESDYAYNELKTAFKAALTAGKINGELNISSDNKKILQNSSVKVFVSGGKGQDVAKIVEGYDEFKNFITNGGEFTKEVPGVPIFFTANYASDNSIFRTSFKTSE